MKFLKWKGLIAFIAALGLILPCGAVACTAIYVGSDLTRDGSTIFGRSEDLGEGYNKLFRVVPAGTHKAGEVYEGCYGFTYTFPCDSYAYTAFCDDNGAAVGHVCPNCGSDHAHSPYEAAGTNEKGVSVTATETLYASEAVSRADPMRREAGIEEAEIPTILLSSCATAREAVDLLLGIYDSVGCQDGAGIFIGDHNETWYIENTTGSQYIALKLNDGLAFSVPNQCVIGLIDLDDTENVIASEDIIAVARQAGTYVGSEAENTIDYIASYSDDFLPNERMESSLKCFSAHADCAHGYAGYALSNVDDAGAITVLHSGIIPDHAYGIEDIVKHFRIDGIAERDNIETHIFQISAEDGPSDTVEWVAMNHAGYSVFIPYYPMLTNDTYAAYQISTPPVSRGDRNENAISALEILPENWRDSMYWSFCALSRLADSGDLSEDQVDALKAAIDKMQNDCYACKEQMDAALASSASPEEAARVCTRFSEQMAEQVHNGVLELIDGLTK